MQALRVHANPWFFYHCKKQEFEKETQLKGIDITLTFLTRFFGSGKRLVTPCK
jgi:hypothetical protein